MFGQTSHRDIHIRVRPEPAGQKHRTEQVALGPLVLLDQSAQGLIHLV